MHNIIEKKHTPTENYLPQNQLIIKIKVCKPTFFTCRG